MAAGDVETDALFECLLRLGDNNLILGHRTSEWCGHAPALEEDIALANTALDQVGQADLWLTLAGEIEGRGRSADDLAYRRDAMDFRNFLLVEQPNGDFGHTLVRQFLFDAWHLPMLQGLSQSGDTRIADIAAKAVKEVTYHLERSTDLVVRLGDGSPESHARVQGALNKLWSFTGEMREEDALQQTMADAGLAPAPASVNAAWETHVFEVLERAMLEQPEGAVGKLKRSGKRGVHSEHLGLLLAEMQFLPRAYPDAKW